MEMELKNDIKLFLHSTKAENIRENTVSFIIRQTIVNWLW